MGVLAVIPARYGSVRFPGKPLAMLQGKPVIQHVYEQVVKATRVDETVVATDDVRIVKAVEQFGGRAVLTSATARSGSERVAEVVRAHDAQIVINVQGDEPLVQPEMVDQLVTFLKDHGAVPMASLMTPFREESEINNPNVVKVVVDQDGYALYFSRAAIPFLRADAATQTRSVFKHLGLYGYQRYFILQFPHLEPTPLEQAEQLEQLRTLEHGQKIKLLETAHDTIGIDTPDDLKRVEALVAKWGARLGTDL